MAISILNIHCLHIILLMFEFVRLHSMCCFFSNAVSSKERHHTNPWITACMALTVKLYTESKDKISCDRFCRKTIRAVISFLLWFEKRKKEIQNKIMRVISNVLVAFPFKTSQINSARQGFSLICFSLADMKEEIFFNRKACPKTFSQNP